jgi:hypothetical protein
MYTYQLTSSGYILRSDGVTIPDDLSNSDYQAYQLWVSQGNAATPVAALTKTQANSQTNAPVLAKIALLEASQTRSVREATLGIAAGATKLKSINDQIDTLRGTLV